jgi:transcriptional regulator GlxA family with amidase domain
MSRSVALVVFDHFDAVDLAAITVFQAANRVVEAPDRYETRVVSATGRDVASAAGIRIGCEPLTDDVHTLIVAGGPGVPHPGDDLLETLPRHAARASRLASVCTGTFVLAQAGLLDAQRVTTHWAYAPELQARFPDLRVEADRIFIEDGHVWTSAGMTACIDLSLALVERDLGAEVARSCARKLVHQRRVGGQSQFSLLSELPASENRVRQAIHYASQHLSSDLSVEDLAAAVHWSPRHLAREFQRHVGLAPKQALERLRVERAVAMLEDGHTSLAKVAQGAGFGDEERMRRAFVRRFGRSPQTLLREIRSSRSSSSCGEPQTCSTSAARRVI